MNIHHTAELLARTIIKFTLNSTDHYCSVLNVSAIFFLFFRVGIIISIRIITTDDQGFGIIDGG